MNTPNNITLVRILMIPIIIFFYLTNFFSATKLVSLALLIIAEATDFLDGYLARKNNQVTNLGKFLDPIADKVLTMASLLLIVVDNTIPAPYGVLFAIIILTREFVISAFRQIAATKNFVMAADKWGKIKTIVTDIAIPVYFFYSYILEYQVFNDTVITVFGYVSFALICLATLLTIISGLNYLIKNKKVLKDND